MPNENSIDLPWVFANAFFPVGPERGPSPDIAALYDARWDFRPARFQPRPRSFRFVVNDGAKPTSPLRSL